MSTQLPLQSTVLGGQTQPPATQSWPLLQAVVQLPQCIGSSWVLTQERSHWVRPELHEGTQSAGFPPTRTASGIGWQT